MVVMLELVSLFLVVAIVIPSAAHALELPGKLRLMHEEYFVVQAIYHPGFAVISAAEPLSIISVAGLLVLTPSGTTIFWLRVVALLATVLTHVLYWALTAPVNKIWLQDEARLGSAHRPFGAGGSADEADWTMFRDLWEWSHLCRAATSVIALVLLAVALVI